MREDAQFESFGPREGCPHKHTLVWIHGLDESPTKHYSIFQSQFYNEFVIIYPKAPVRHVTVMGKPAPSWFDVKFRSDQSFIVPFDQAFSSSEVLLNFQTILKPIIEDSHRKLKENNPDGKLIVGGFSQGGGMSLHCFYHLGQIVDGVIGVSGYLFPFTEWRDTPRFHKIVYGKEDMLRPWEYVKVTYEGKIGGEHVALLEETKHEVNWKVIEEVREGVKAALGI